jgi:hypothetical protein
MTTTRQENIMTANPTVVLTCDCTACVALPDVAADHCVLDGIPANMGPTAWRKQIAHTYVQYAAGTSTLAQIMRNRYSVVQVSGR